jgi:putative tryptophan/tyrosine transport system substrate-binding protein
MKRRDFVTLAGAAAAWPIAGWAQSATVPVIGVLSATNQPDFLVDAFHKGLAEAGYVEGRNLAIVSRSAEDNFDRLAALAADLVGRHVAVIFATGAPVPARAAKALTDTIPIVFAYGGDPVSDNLVSNFNRPGGNVTGATFIGAALSAKRLELLGEILPRLTDVALLVNPKGTLAEIQIRDAEAATQRKGQRLHVVNASSESEIDKAFAAIVQSKVNALMVATDPIFGIALGDRIIALAERHKIPAMYPSPSSSRAGGLIGYGANVADAWRQAGVYVGRILKGEKAADLPIIQPTRFELVVNLKTAKALGLAIPESFLLRADEVIE